MLRNASIHTFSRGPFLFCCTSLHAFEMYYAALFQLYLLYQILCMFNVTICMMDLILNL